MKIFNWVHRRFANKEELTESGKKSCAVDSDGENNAVNVFDGWKQGILTIGTLGCAYEQKDDYCFDDEAEEISDSEEEEEETKPLVYAKDCEEYLEMKRDNDNLGNGDQEFDNYNKERITLAELFYADTEKLQMTKQSNPINHEKTQVIKDEQQQHYHNKNKNKPARPIHKLHRMMRRMMKRKIHPDEGLKNSTKIGDININITTETALLVPRQGEDAII